MFMYFNEQSAGGSQPVDLIKTEIEYVTNFYQLIMDFLTNYSFQLVGAFLIFLFGYFVAGKIAKFVLGICEKHNLDVTLSRFLANTTKMLIVIMVVIVALSKLGVSVTPFIAAIGAVSLGASLAFQGLLSNYAAGFNIILIRPFVVGDTIEVQGVKGIVQEVLLAYTVIKDANNVDITIPNKHIVGEILHNSKKLTLLEMKVGISYSDNPLKVIDIVEKAIIDVVEDDELRLDVGIDEFADSSINIGVRVWVPTSTLYQIKYQGYKAIYTAFEQNNVTIPFPQRDVHLISAPAD